MWVSNGFTDCIKQKFNYMCKDINDGNEFKYYFNCLHFININ